MAEQWCKNQDRHCQGQDRLEVPRDQEPTEGNNVGILK